MTARTTLYRHFKTLQFAIVSNVALACFFAPLESARAQEPVAASSEAASEQARFAIWEFRVLGNSVMKGADIERVLYPFLGESKTVDDVQQARQALETAYRDRGYATVFVDVPEQDVDQHIVRLSVTEGKLDRVRVTGARYFSGRQLLTELPAAKSGSVPHIGQLQNELQAANTVSVDRQVVPVLRAGSRPGTVDLELKVQDELPLHGSAELNNEYAPETSPLRVRVAANYDHLFAHFDSLAAQYQIAPEEPDEVQVFAASYAHRLTYAGTKLSFFFIDSNSNVATAGSGGSSLSVLGKGQIYGTRLMAPIVATAESTQIVLGGAEYKDFTESVFTQELVLTPITYINFSVGHNSIWRLPKQQWALSNTVNFGVREAVNDTDEFRIKRAYGVPNYFYLRGDGSFIGALPANFTVRLSVAYQLAVDAIISNEQFSIAGAAGVRGYMEAEVLGDIGLHSSFEIATPHWRPKGDSFDFGAFVFFDYGRASHISPLRELLTDKPFPVYGELLERPNITLRSSGVGINMSIGKYFRGAFAWAYALDDSGVADGTKGGDSRIHFTVQAAF